MLGGSTLCTSVILLETHAWREKRDQLTELRYLAGRAEDAD